MVGRTATVHGSDHAARYRLQRGGHNKIKCEIRQNGVQQRGRKNDSKTVAEPRDTYTNRSSSFRTAHGGRDDSVHDLSQRQNRPTPRRPTYFLISSSFAGTKRESASYHGQWETREREMQTWRSLSRAETVLRLDAQVMVHAQSTIFIEF